MGDGVLLHFGEPADAIRASLELVGSTSVHGLPPAHVGIEAGPMLYDEGDYFGRTVNLAARIASQATAGRVFVGEGVASLVAEDGFTLREVGGFELKGIAGAFRISEAVDRT
jgi:adenylate cyclase